MKQTNKNDDQKNKEKKRHKDRKNYNATSMNDISQIQQRPRMSFDGKDTLEGIKERKRN